MRGFNVETVFGALKRKYGFRRFVFRRKSKVSIEIGLFFIGYNLFKMWKKAV